MLASNTACTAGPPRRTCNGFIKSLPQPRICHSFTHAPDSANTRLNSHRESGLPDPYISFLRTAFFFFIREIRKIKGIFINARRIYIFNTFFAVFSRGCRDNGWFMVASIKTNDSNFWNPFAFGIYHDHLKYMRERERINHIRKRDNTNVRLPPCVSTCHFLDFIQPNPSTIFRSNGRNKHDGIYSSRFLRPRETEI